MTTPARNTSEFRQLNDDAGPAHRGFRLQSLYVLYRLFNATVDHIYCPEGIEDLSICDGTGKIIEVVQVKGYTRALTASSLGKPFFRRAGHRITTTGNRVPLTIASFGSIGANLSNAIASADSDARRTFVAHVGEILGDSKLAAMIAASLRLEEVSEKEVIQSITEQLGRLCTGVDPVSALEILWWWLFSAAERHTNLNRNQVIEKVASVGRFCAERTAFQTEWHTSIEPIVTSSDFNANNQKLAHEFASGVAARFEHIAMGLDVRRDGFLDRIHEAFAGCNIVVVHGASGQGKTALGYRYCHEFFPDDWRFRVNLIQSASHAQKIALALRGHAQAVSSRILVMVDVRPGDIAWLDLVRSLADKENVDVLVTLREEDWKRAFSSLFPLKHHEIELELCEEEARKVFASLRSLYDIRHAINFEDAWEGFGRSGPFLEFVYFLHHNNSVKERLRTQVVRLQDEERRGDLPARELELLRLVSVATEYEARVDVLKLVEALGIKEPQRVLENYEKEYFLRLTPGKKHVVSLHPIRSAFLVELLTDEAVCPWWQVAGKVLPIIDEMGLERFLLNSFARRESSRRFLVEAINAFQPTTWLGLSGCLRSLIWLGVREYIDDNSPLIEEAFSRLKDGWWVLFNADIAGIADLDVAAMFSSLGERGKNAAAAAQSFQERQKDRRLIFCHVKGFLLSRTGVINAPDSPLHWRALGEVFFWLGHLNAQSPITELLSDNLLTESLACKDIEAVGEALVGVFTFWGDKYLAWLERNRETVLAAVYPHLHIAFLNETEAEVEVVFLLPGNDRELMVDASEFSSTPARSINDLTVSRLRILRNMVPNKKAYICKGIGHRNDLIVDAHDESIKNMPVENLLPRWGPELNGLFSKLATYAFRPDDWTTFLDRMLGQRQKAIDCLLPLKRGILTHFEKATMIDIVDSHPDWKGWESLQVENYQISLLPKCAVDPLGMDSAAVGGEEHPQKTALDAFSKAAREYCRTLDNFLNQAPPVLMGNAALGKAAGKKDRKRIIKHLESFGIHEDDGRLSTINLVDFCKSLLSFQRDAWRLVRDRPEAERHKILSSRELAEFPRLCVIWNQFHKSPEYHHDAARRKAQVRYLANDNVTPIKSLLLKKLKREAKRRSGKTITYRVLNTDATWQGEPTLWIVGDMSDMGHFCEFSHAVESIVAAGFSTCTANDGHRLISELFWKRIVALPLVGGKSLRKQAYPNMSGVWLPSRRELDWRHIPEDIQEVDFLDLRLEQWQKPELLKFQALADSVSMLWLYVAHFADLFRSQKGCDEKGHEVLQHYITQRQDTVNALYQNAIDRCEKFCDQINILDEQKVNEHPLMLEAASVLIKGAFPKLILDGEDGTRLVSLDVLAGWTTELLEAIKLVQFSEILFSADHLGLQCDIPRLERSLAN